MTKLTPYDLYQLAQQLAQHGDEERAEVIDGFAHDLAAIRALPALPETEARR